MALLSKKEFSDLCGIKSTSIPAYKLRKKVVVRADGMVDSEDPTNKVFITQQSAKKITESEEKDIISRIAKYPAAQKQENKHVDTSHTDAFNSIMEEVENAENKAGVKRKGVPKYDESVVLLKYLDTLKRQSEIELNNLKLQKQRGEVVPSELIQQVFISHNQGLIIAFKNAAEEFIRVFGSKKSLSNEEVSDLKGQFVSIINDSMDRAITDTAQNVENIIKDYTLKRATGERE